MAVPKWDRRHVEIGQPVEDPLDVRKHELPVVGFVESADPRVEDLHGLDPGLDLGLQVVPDHIGEKTGEQMPGLRLGVHEPLGLPEVARASTLDGVRGEGERRSGEANEWDRQLAAQQPDGFEDHAQLLAGFEPAKRLHVGP